jgi:hypothetical protein
MLTKLTSDAHLGEHKRQLDIQRDQGRHSSLAEARAAKQRGERNFGGESTALGSRRADRSQRRGQKPARSGP